MLFPMWGFPVAAGVVALAFAALLGRQFWARRRPFQAMWALAMLMYAVASFMLVLGLAGGWTPAEYRIYWALGGVLNVPYLAAGEVNLLLRRREVLVVVVLLLLFVTGFTVARVATAPLADPSALLEDLPSGKEVFGPGTPAHRLPQVVAIPAYAVLLAGIAWSAWGMRGRPGLRDRFLGVLAIALGATVVAAAGSAFAALGRFVEFSLSLLVGVAVMFWGFLRASRQVPSVAAPGARASR